MLATYINCLAILAGSVLGLLFGKLVTDTYQKIVLTGTGFVTVAIAISMALATQNWLVVTFSVILGGLFGTALRIEDHVSRFGTWLQKLGGGKGDSNSFAQGFLSSSVLFCTGAMAIVGSLNAGIRGDYQLILVKSVMDGCVAVAFAASYGAGVAAAALPVLIYQGFFTLCGRVLEPVLRSDAITEMGAVGGVLLLMVGFNLLDVRRTKVGDFLPAIILAPFVLAFVKLFS